MTSVKLIKGPEKHYCLVLIVHQVLRDVLRVINRCLEPAGLL